MRHTKIILAAAFFLLALPAFAHDSTLSYTVIDISESSVAVNYTTPERNILALYPSSRQPYPEYQSYFTSRFVFENGNASCKPAVREIARTNATGSVSILANFECGEITVLNSTYNMFFEISDTHENVALVTIANASGTAIYSKGFNYYEFPVRDLLAQLGVKNETATNATSESNATNAQNALTPNNNVIFSFFALGVGHIFTGYDHILFIIGLLLVAFSFAKLAKIITSFTIAHSVTLIAASLGIFVIDPRLTESFIAITIIFIAAENILILRSKNKNKRKGLRKFLADPSKRWRIGFALGLIHGFGFSSALREIGLPKEDLIPSLLSFNLGVEAGQLVIVSLLFPVLLYARKKKWHRNVVLAISALIGLIGLALLVQRLLVFI